MENEQKLITKGFKNWQNFAQALGASNSRHTDIVPPL
jgi:hypothetical protein